MAIDDKIGGNPPGAKPDVQSHSAHRAALLAESVRRGREAFLARTAHITPDEFTRQVEQLQRQAPATGGTGTAIGRAVERVAPGAAPRATLNPKMWAADIKPLRARAPDTNGWLRQVRAAARTRVAGDPFETTIIRGAEVLLWFVRTSGNGWARQTFEQLAAAFRTVPETARRVVRFLERAGLLDTFNVLSRRGDQVRRDANLYLIPDAPADDAPAAPSLTDRLARYADAFGLVARAWGLNATAAPVGTRPAWTRSAPA